MKKCFVIGVLLCAVVTVGQAQHAARGLAQRILGDKASAFEFVLTKDSGDVFTLSQNGGKIRIEGSNDNAMCMGLNYYLKAYAHVHVSWYASQPVELPRRMPKVTEPVTHRCKMPVRFFLNYCTYGYTMVWWRGRVAGGGARAGHDRRRDTRLFQRSGAPSLAPYGQSGRIWRTLAAKVD